MQNKTQNIKPQQQKILYIPKYVINEKTQIFRRFLVNLGPCYETSNSRNAFIRAKLTQNLTPSRCWHAESKSETTDLEILHNRLRIKKL